MAMLCNLLHWAEFLKSILMKKLLMITLVLLAQLGFSQFPPDDKKFSMPEILPSYKGGDGAMLKFLAENIKMPDIDVEGTVYVTFTVDTLGNVTDVKTLRGIHPLADAEAVRVVKLLGKFTPGTMSGKKANTQLNIPIRFKRPDEEK
jgi:TonB family protein